MQAKPAAVNSLKDKNFASARAVLQPAVERVGLHKLDSVYANRGEAGLEVMDTLAQTVSARESVRLGAAPRSSVRGSVV